MDKYFTIAFICIFLMALVWFALLKVIFNKLKSHHNDKYIQMGEPGLIINNNIKTGLAIFKFLIMREHTKLNDHKLSKLCDFSLAFFGIYLIK